MGTPIEERFWAKVDKRGPDECWEWTASKKRDGYGQFRVDAKMVMAHRYVFELCCGRIPLGMCVCHHCDNRACVNPCHLFLGTNVDNIRDKCAKNRQLKGETSPRAKLTDAQVLEIRDLLKRGAYYRDVARLYGMGATPIWNIGSGQSWAHLLVGTQTTALYCGRRARKDAASCESLLKCSGCEPGHFSLTLSEGCCQVASVERGCTHGR